MTIDLFEQLERHAIARPHDVALQTMSASSSEPITFRELIDGARALSQRIRDAGVQPGGRAGLLMPNDHRFGVAFLAAASAGAIIVPLDPSHDATRLCDVLAHAECVLLICPNEGSFAEQACAIRNRMPELAFLDPGGFTASVPLPSWPLGPRDSDNDFLLMYTGGTTGAPKGVRLSLRGILVTIGDTLAEFPLSARDHVLSILPMFHIMAIQANLLGPLYAGARITYLQSRDPRVIVDAFRKQEITAFLCVPLFYYQLHRRIFDEIARQPQAKRAVFGALLRLSRFLRTAAGLNAGRLFFRPIHERFGHRLRGFGVGAARFAPEIASELHDLGFNFFQGYGMTETSGLATISPMSLKGGLTSGRPLQNLELRIDSSNAERGGEILLRGDNIMKGYWKDPEATQSAIADGWLHTGDIGRFAGGNLHVIGRKKEVIVLSSGKNIFPEPLEAWFQSHCHLIQEICIFGIAEDSKGAERLHALLVPDLEKLRERGIVNVRQELYYQIENLNRRLPAHERLNGLDVRFESLPRTSSRKLQRFRIQEEFERNRSNSARKESEPTQAAQEPSGMATVRDLIARIKPGREIHAGMNLELDLAFDSLERVELLANIQEACGFRLAPEQAAGIFTVSDIVALVRDRHAPQLDWIEWRQILRAPLTETERATADRYLGARPLAAPLLFIATRLFSLIAKLLLRYRFRAQQKWSDEGPLILCANHQSYLDFPLIAGSLPYSVFRRIFSLSATRLLQSPFQSWFGRAARSVPIDSDLNLRSALRIAAEGLRRGMVLCVFPEGHRSIDGQLQPFRRGAAIVAVESGARTVPIGIAGTGRAWGRGSNRIRLAPVRINCGAVLHPIPDEDYDTFNRRLFNAVKDLFH